MGEMEPGWRDITKELPPDWTRVMVYDPSSFPTLSSKNSNGIRTAVYSIKDGWILLDSGYYPKNITHWSYFLPPPA